MFFKPLLVTLAFVHSVKSVDRVTGPIGTGNCPQNVKSISYKDINMQDMGGMWYMQGFSKDIHKLWGCDACYCSYWSQFNENETHIDTSCRRNGEQYTNQILGSGLFTVNPAEPDTVVYESGALVTKGYFLSVDPRTHWIGGFCFPTNGNDGPDLWFYFYKRTPKYDPTFDDFARSVMEKSGLGGDFAYHHVIHNDGCMYPGSPAVLPKYYY